MRAFGLVTLFLLSCAGATAATPSLKGREFWLSVPRITVIPPDRITLEVVADAATTVEIDGNLSVSGAAAPTTPFSVDLANINLAGAYNATGTWGIHIRTPSANSQVYLRHSNNNFGAEARVAVHPVSSIGSSYRLDLGTDGIAAHGGTITAISDGTQVTLQNLCGNPGPQNQPLNRGETYHFACLPGSFVHGTSMTSSAPVAVIVADRCAILPPTSCCCEPLVIMPSAIAAWGVRSYLPALPRGSAPTSDSDYVHVIASVDATNVRIDDGTSQDFLVNTDRGLLAEYQGPAVVTSDQPVAVEIYEKSSDERGRLGDPELLAIVPAHAYDTRARFLTESGWSTENLLAFVTDSVGACGITLDGNPLTLTWQAFPDGLQSYSTLLMSGDGEHEVISSSPMALYVHAHMSGLEGSLGTDVMRRFLAPGDCSAWVGSCTPPAVETCVGDTVSLDASSSAATDCSGSLVYRWTRDGSPVPAWDDMPAVSTTFTAPAQVELVVTCSTVPACTDRFTWAVTMRADSIPGDQGNTLLAARNATSVYLDYSGATAGEWAIFRDTSKTAIGSTVLVPDTLLGSVTDAGAVSLPGDFFYAIRGLSPCSKTPGP